MDSVQPLDEETALRLHSQQEKLIDTTTAHVPEERDGVMVIDCTVRVLENVGFDKGGYGSLIKRGYVNWAKDVIFNRHFILFLAPIPKEVMEALWIFVVSWYINHSPGMTKARSKWVLNIALNQVNKLGEREEEHWRLFQVSELENKKYVAMWNGVEFFGVNKYLTQESLKHPGEFVYGSKFVRSPKDVLSVGELIEQRMENLKVAEKIWYSKKDWKVIQKERSRKLQRAGMEPMHSLSQTLNNEISKSRKKREKQKASLQKKFHQEDIKHSVQVVSEGLEFEGPSHQETAEKDLTPFESEEGPGFISRSSLGRA